MVVLGDDGVPVGPPRDLRARDRGHALAPLLTVPRPVKRTSGIAPHFLWDKTAYALGVTAGTARRTAREHAAFVARHLDALAGHDDPGLRALRRFVESWRPRSFEDLGWPEEMKDHNLVFALDAPGGVEAIHERPAAHALWASLVGDLEAKRGVCIATARRGPVARLHPAIKGVFGAATTGGSLVSFNRDAFCSYGFDQGENAPVSEEAVFAYTSALNAFLLRDSGHCAVIGDTTMVFWADGDDHDRIVVAEAVIGAVLGTASGGDGNVTPMAEDALREIHAGRPLPERSTWRGTRMHILALAPNAARLSVRFWVEDDFADMAERIAKLFGELRVDPSPKDGSITLGRCLWETGSPHDAGLGAPRLVGDWLNTIITGRPGPRSLLAVLVMRMRADRRLTPLRAAMLKALLISTDQVRDVPVSLYQPVKRSTHRGIPIFSDL
jgi:CRISPR-associated protein Csd1